MKKYMALLLLLLCLTGCGRKGMQSEKYEVVIVPQAWSEEADLAIKAEAEDYPMLNIYQNTSEEPDARYQALLVEDLMAQEVDAICIDPVDAEVLAPALEKAEAAGIRIVVGTDIPAMLNEAAERLAG
ncbi:MAG: substrate-binding domain-containing protein [Oscillospiraceae bacterium]|nr:substrate-binding domain-containing protein [Oscillospiraceae bacterium]